MPDRAMDIAKLTARAESNRRYGSADFDDWVRSLLDDLSFETVLELGCGAGNQLIHYGAKGALEYVVGVDVSADALEIAERRLAEVGSPRQLVHAPMEHAFTHPALVDDRFDLVSCFYALYYAREPRAVLQAMIAHADRAVLVVGPWGQNNATLFDLMRAYGPLPKLAEWSSTGFMEEIVLPTIDASSLDLDVSTFTSEVSFPDVEAFLAYWRASGFHDPSAEVEVARDIEARYAAGNPVVIEKHAMAAIGRKAAS